MKSRKSRLVWQFSSVFILTILFVFPIWAQDDDTNPDSPTPILISEPDSTRALTTYTGIANRNSRLFQSRAFRLNSRITLYATNLDLMKDEDTNAFRVYAEDARGRKYRFPVLSIQPLQGKEWIYAVQVQLRDQAGFWEQPRQNGDLLLSLTWRGLVSNAVKIGLGRTGGKLNEVADAVPTPMKNFENKLQVDTPITNYVGYRYSGDRIRFLEQATFGPTTELDQRIRRIGLRTWLAEQFQAQYPSPGNPLPEFALKSSDSSQPPPLGCSPYVDSDNTIRTCYRDYYSMYPLQKWFFREALYGDAQLKHRVTWALSQMWVTSGVSLGQSSHMIAYYKILANNSFGNYRDLMEEMTLSPAMGDYLDMARSRKSSPNENYAREILQLFTIGLFQLNQNGTLKLSNGQPIPTYDQTTVNNFAKVFTGWSFCNNGNDSACPNALAGTVNFKDPMLLNQSNHDVSQKNLLNYSNAVNATLPVNQDGATDLDQALDNIFNHPNVPPFVSRILIQNLVTSDPTPAYVGRVAAVFANNGFGVRGDMKSVVKAILLDPEARGNVKTSPTYGKLREPVQYMTNILRQFNVRSADGNSESDGVMAGTANSMGQDPFKSPTVFNYYSPDYLIPGTDLNGPEFGLMNTGTSISRANVAQTLSFSKLYTYRDAPDGTSIDLSEMTQLAQNDETGNQLLDVLNTRLMHGVMTAAMRNTILTAVQAIAANQPATRAKQAIYLIVTSSQYQVQR